MPAQIPREATSYFGSLLCPYVHDMVSERVLQAASLTRTIYTDWLYQYRLALSIQAGFINTGWLYQYRLALYIPPKEISFIHADWLYSDYPHRLASLRSPTQSHQSDQLHMSQVMVKSVISTMKIILCTQYVCS